MMAAAESPGIALSTLLRGIVALPPRAERQVLDITLDSREVTPGACFLALAGSIDDGRRHVSEAAARGAVAIIAEHPLSAPRPDLPVLQVTALRDELGTIANRFFATPSAALSVCAVTGTNGKTSVAHLLAQAGSRLGLGGGYLGTLGAGELARLSALANTTPDIITSNRWLARFRDRGVRLVAVEASSHALAQQRLRGLALRAAAFTNLGHDHLDYHGDLAAYADSKRSLFDQPGIGAAAINIDDALGAQIAAGLPRALECWTCSSRGRAARVRAVDSASTVSGMQFKLHVDGESASVHSRLAGRFNVDNLLLVVALLRAIKQPFDAICATLDALTGVPGRAQDCGTSAAGARIFVDYAHSPDSLAAILAALRELAPVRLLLVFGCGGDRDRSKRPLMGAIAERDADQVIITTDNSRSESATTIASEILGGMREPARVAVIDDRAQAIGHAIAVAGAGDIVLIAGKGHETTQVRGGRVTPFSDHAEIANVLARVRV